MPIDLFNETDIPLTFRAHTNYYAAIVKYVPSGQLGLGDPRSRSVPSGGSKEIFQDTNLSTVGGCMVSWYNSNDWTFQSTELGRASVPNNGALKVKKICEGGVSCCEVTDH